MVGLALSDKAAISSPMVTMITANLMICRMLRQPLPRFWSKAARRRDRRRALLYRRIEDRM